MNHGFLNLWDQIFLDEYIMHGCFELVILTCSFLLLFGFTFTSNLGSSLFRQLRCSFSPFFGSLCSLLYQIKKGILSTDLSSQSFPHWAYALGKTLPQTHSPAPAHSQVGKRRDLRMRAQTHRKSSKYKVSQQWYEKKQTQHNLETQLHF